ncbi:hypothetical protein ASPVEDRAFT_202097 [Aspergillus versicolor CBS 583.65]|uniref:GST N-terminal domain-containing protein n=1 Tax=Aspergillus versicolor CBS 583.65 TaxID=1036611 RepID=A0A1L9Q0P5_ASPVE|nr:uncharacterized protein ASPVEDRAFT_202097 [Aspergillus versicolor CBS 583.65]OJJ07348.1 hypothetical protein ASPVEDRAFT_202097 [Aspergillus versicolor CBS 583.65]
MTDVKFFFFPGACSLAPHILLHEAGIDFTPLKVERNGTEVVFPQEYRDVNPKMRVPVIVVGDEVITELPAVCAIISQLSKEKKFMGRTPLDTVRVYEWLNYLSGTVHASAFGHLFRPWRWTTSDDLEIHNVIKEKARENITVSFEYIESRLRDGIVYAVGHDLTAVDAFLYAMYRWAKSSGLVLTPYPKYARLVENIEKRETMKVTLEKEGLDNISL